MTRKALTISMRSILVAAGLAVFAQEGVAQAQDDSRSTKSESAAVSDMAQAKTNAKTDACIEFGNPKSTNRYFKYEIRKPGHYCLTENMHARTEFPAPEPVSAESTMIDIRTSDVVLDLQGHTLGRGRIFKNPGGLGVRIVDSDSYAQSSGKAKNIVIKNGTLQDFETGIEAARWDDTIADTPNFDAQSNTYHFPYNNITLENVAFKNCGKRFNMSAPGAPRK